LKISERGFFQYFLKSPLLQKLPKNLEFYKNFPKIFFAKYERNVDMKNAQELNFCSKNDQIMSMSNKPK
jgi:hypothetical protein